MNDESSITELRVLALCPTPKDFELTRGILQKAGIETECCLGLAHLCKELSEGAGAVLVVEEALSVAGDDALSQYLTSQPSWSDLPVLVLARAGIESTRVATAMERLGTVAVLERPVRVSGLVSAVRSALQARKRQYQVRDDGEQLKRNHKTFFNLVKNTPFGTYIVDCDFRLAHVSRGCSKVFADIDPLLGRDFGDILRILWPEEFAKPTIAHFRHTMLTGEPYHSPNTTEQRANIRVVESYDWQIERISMPDGRFGVVCYFYETTEQVHAEQDAVFLANLSEHCRTSTDADDLLRQVTRQVGVYLAADRCFVNEIYVTDDKWTIRDDYYREGSVSLAGQYKLSDYDPEILSALSHGVVDTVGDTIIGSHTASRYHTSYEPLGIRSYVTVPLLRDGAWISNFIVTSESARGWEQREVSLLEAIAERVWNAVERARAEEGLRTFQERIDLVKDTAEVGFWFCDLPFDELIWDARVKEHFWLPPDAYVTIDTFYEQIHPEDRERIRGAVNSSVEHNRKYDVEYRTVSPRNEEKLIRAIGRTFYSDDGRPIRFDGVTLDITALRQAENAIRDRELLESSVRYQEAERQRIARDLHDQLGQTLTGLRLTLAELHQGATGLPGLNEIVEKAQKCALELDKDVSSLAFQLRASDVGEKGLSKALEDLVGEWSISYGIGTDFHAVKTSDTSLSPEIENHIYRIAQESLNNTTKYAKATAVSVLLEIGENFVRFIVEDNGIGFDPAAVPARSHSGAHGLGLIGMRERAALLNGSLEIESEPGKGTTIYVTVPR